MQHKLETQHIEHLKIMALADYLEIDYDAATDLIDSGDYLVLTDSEADEVAREYIEDSLWAFSYNFLASHSEAINHLPEKDFQEMQERLCEGFNAAVKAMIDDLEHFIDDAIVCDGRGHFISQYDGEEIELDNNLFAYRIN